MFEKNLYAPLIKHFEANHHISFEFQPYKEKTYRKRIDIFLVNKKSETISIEVKVNDWIRALKQAIENMCHSNYSYVALPYEKAEKIEKTLFLENGIGLIGVRKEKVEELISPRFNY
jgi:hypothetical protein